MSSMETKTILTTHVIGIYDILWFLPKLHRCEKVRDIDFMLEDLNKQKGEYAGKFG